MLLATVFLLFSDDFQRGERGASCIATSDCADGLACRDKLCAPDGLGEHCRRSADCAQSLQCVLNQCRMPQTLAGVRVERRPWKELWHAGLGLFLSSYLAHQVITLVLTSISFGQHFPMFLFGLIPIAGPFVSLANANPLALGLNSVSGILQVGGVAMLVTGLILKKHYLTWGDPKFSATLTPALSPSFQGLSLSGAF